MVRFCIRRAIRIQEIVAELKKEFVKEAIAELRRVGEEPSLSRISAISGIPRKFVRAHLDSLDEAIPINDVPTKVVTTWKTKSEYLQKRSNKPRILGCEGNTSEFAQLVRSVSVDLNPYTVLNELERTGIVLRNDGKIQLQSRLYLERDLDKAFELGARDADALMQVIQKNVEQKLESRLHLATEYDNIPDCYVEEIRNWLLLEGSKFHKKVSDYLQSYDRDFSNQDSDEPGVNTVRVVAFEHTHPSE
ncbi:MAG: hypothetical protein KDD70_03075 [Bdellovibrionales bacterium]|nr:hypothetical protein [Bdellovibrionales bacterium]